MSIRINKESVDFAFDYQLFYKRADGMLWFEYWLDHDCIYIMCVIISESVLLIFCALFDVSIGCIVFHS